MRIPEIKDLWAKEKFSEALDKIDKLNAEDRLEGEILKVFFG
ncbi:MAG: hypothetical protein ACFFBQ_10040 [Promethearchaeota archaeon]